jgi:hypothetical protein
MSNQRELLALEEVGDRLRAKSRGSVETQEGLAASFSTALRRICPAPRTPRVSEG